MPFLSEVDDSLTILNRSHWEVRAGAFQLMSAAQRGVELTASKASLLPKPHLDLSPRFGRETGDRLRRFRRELRGMDVAFSIQPGERSLPNKMAGGALKTLLVAPWAVKKAADGAVLGVVAVKDLYSAAREAHCSLTPLHRAVCHLEDRAVEGVGDLVTGVVEGVATVGRETVAYACAHPSIDRSICTPLERSFTLLTETLRSTGQAVHKGENWVVGQLADEYGISEHFTEEAFRGVEIGASYLLGVGLSKTDKIFAVVIQRERTSSLVATSRLDPLHHMGAIDLSAIPPIVKWGAGIGAMGGGLIIQPFLIIPMAMGLCDSPSASSFRRILIGVRYWGTFTLPAVIVGGSIGGAAGLAFKAFVNIAGK